MKRKSSALFIFQLGKAEENAKLLTCCLKNTSSISKQSSPTTRLTHDKTRFSKGVVTWKVLKPLPHSTERPRNQNIGKSNLFENVS